MDFSAVKLRKVQVNEKHLNTQISFCDSEADFSRLLDEAELEQYFEAIKGFTFRSTFMELPREAADALKRLHLEYKANKPVDITSEPSLMALAARIDEEIRKQFAGGPVFIRLSSRSPKDAALSRPNLQQELQSTLQRIKAADAQLLSGGNTDVVANSDLGQRIYALYSVGTTILKLTRGIDAVQLLMESERVSFDIARVADGEKSINVVIREFQSFDVQFEFRGFVYNRKLTALTQYNHVGYFPLVKMYSETILSRIRSFVEETLIPSLPPSSKHCVIDIVLANENESDGGVSLEKHQSQEASIEEQISQMKVFIIELNPFAEFAGGGLFTWTEDMDVLVGRKPFEFRVAANPPTTTNGMHIGNDWISMLNSM